VGIRNTFETARHQVTANGQLLVLKQQTHRSPAWGVLGSAIGGVPFLLTHPVVFRSIYEYETPPARKVSQAIENSKPDVNLSFIET
jgi:hypothetical protein